MAAQNLFQSYMQPVRSVADYEGDLQQQDMRRLQIQGAERNNAMAALAQRQQMQGMQRNALVQAAQRAAAERAAGDEGAYGRNMRLSGLPELIDQADKIDKAAAERGKAKSENAKRDTETENNVIAMWRDMIGGAVDQQQAAQMFTAMRADPRIQNTPVAQVPLELGLRSLSEKPLDQWKKEFALGATKYVEMNKPTYQQQNLGGTMQTLALPGLGGAPTVAAAAPITQSADNAATQATARANQARMSADAAAGRAQSAAQFNQRLAYDQAKEKTSAAGGGRTGPMSVTLQKELLESDDAAQSSAAVIGTLNRALAINKDAYSGYLAKPRATLRSNLPGQSTAADATINLDNMMTGQALESLKVTFGAAPTEGERKILMDMQASADKTPAQREDIINRAIAAAERRGAYASRKAEAIRSGRYLSEGVQQPSAPVAPPAAPKPGALVDGYRFKGGNPADKANWERQ